MTPTTLVIAPFSLRDGTEITASPFRPVRLVGHEVHTETGCTDVADPGVLRTVTVDGPYLGRLWKSQEDAAPATPPCPVCAHPMLAGEDLDVQPGEVLVVSHKACVERQREASAMTYTYRIEPLDDLGAMPAALACTGQTFEQVTAWLDAHVDVGTFVIVDEADGQPACLHPWGLAGGAAACECGRPECPTEDPHADTFGNPWYRALVDLLEDPDRDRWHTPEQVAALRLALPSVSDEASLRAALAPLEADLRDVVVAAVKPSEHGLVAPEHIENARRYFGTTAPEDIIEASARCRAWRPFAQHTDEQTAAHKADLAKVDAYEATIKPIDLPGADPMGDE